MKKILFIMMALLVSLPMAAKREKVIKVSVQPQEAAIYIDNNLIGYGYGEFTRPQKKKPSGSH